MIQADVNAQVAWAILSSVPREGAISQDVTKFLGSAYKAYSTALAHDDSLIRNTGTGELYKELVSSFEGSNS